MVMMMMATSGQKNRRGRCALVGLFRWARRMIENVRSRKKRSKGVRIRLKDRFKGTMCRTQRVRGAFRGDRFVDMIIDRIAQTRRTCVRISKAQGRRRRDVRTSHVRRRRTRRRTELKKIGIRSCRRRRRGSVIGLRLRVFRRGRRGRRDGIRLLVIQMLHQTTLQLFVSKRRLRFNRGFAFRLFRSSSRKHTTKINGSRTNERTRCLPLAQITNDDIHAEDRHGDATQYSRENV